MGKYWITGRYWTFPLTAVELVSSSSTVPLNTLFLECSWLSCVSAELQSRVEVLNARFQVRQEELDTCCRAISLYRMHPMRIQLHLPCISNVSRCCKRCWTYAAGPSVQVTCIQCVSSSISRAYPMYPGAARGAGHLLQGHQCRSHESNAYPIPSSVQIQCTQVLQEMLDMLRDHQNNSHASRLELIIVWLLVVDCCLMLCQVSWSLSINLKASVSRHRSRGIGLEASILRR
eukprot:1053416-Pelagomonas_calceolata.AAC.2